MAKGVETLIIGTGSGIGGSGASIRSSLLGSEGSGLLSLYRGLQLQGEATMIKGGSSTAKANRVMEDGRRAIGGDGIERQKDKEMAEIASLGV